MRSRRNGTSPAAASRKRLSQLDAGIGRTGRTYRAAALARVGMDEQLLWRYVAFVDDIRDQDGLGSSAPPDAGGA